MPRPIRIAAALAACALAVLAVATLLATRSREARDAPVAIAGAVPTPAPDGAALQGAEPDEPDADRIPAPAGEAQRASAAGPTGWVRSATDGAPIANVTVAFFAVDGEHYLGSTRTAADGSFTCPSAPASYDVHARAPRGYAPEGDRAAVRGGVPQDDLVLLLRAIPSARVRGRVLDGHSGAPIDWARVRLTDDAKRTEELRVDAEGRFESEQVYPLGGELRVVAHEAQTMHVLAGITTVHHDGSELTIVVQVGPRIELDIPVAELDVEEWRARIVETDPTGEDRHWAWIRLRDGRWPWIRYPRQTHLPDPQRTARIDVEREDRAVLGSGPLRATVGEHPGVVQITLRELASLHAGVVGAQGTPLPETVATLVPLPGNRTPSDFEHWVERVFGGGTDAGSFSMANLEPGPWRLTVKPRDGELWIMDLLLPAGHTDLGTIALATQPIAGDVRGVLVGREGGPQPGALLRLRSTTNAAVERWSLVGDGSRIGGRWSSQTLFAFGDLPVGDYELSAFPLHGVRFEPETVRVSPPADGVTFRQVDDDDRRPFAFRVTDAETGEPVERFRVQLGAADSRLGRSSYASNEQPVGALEPGERLEWTVFADGHGAASGDASAFDREGDLLVADVELPRGWGALVLVKDGDWLGARPDAADHGGLRGLVAPPIENVQVRADGVPVGATDASGAAPIALAARPAAITVHLPGWRVVGTRNVEKGSLDANATEAIFWLGRE